MISKEEALDILSPREDYESVTDPLEVIVYDTKDVTSKRKNSQNKVRAYKADVAVEVWQNLLQKLTSEDANDKRVAYESALSRVESISRKNGKHKRKEAKVRRRSEPPSQRRDRYNYDPE